MAFSKNKTIVKNTQENSVLFRHHVPIFLEQIHIILYVCSPRRTQNQRNI